MEQQACAFLGSDHMRRHNGQSHINLRATNPIQTNEMYSNSLQNPCGHRVNVAVSMLLDGTLLICDITGFIA